MIIEPVLSKLDRINLVISALHLLEILDPQIPKDNWHIIRSHRVLNASNNAAYLEEISCEQMPEWSPEEIKAYAIEQLQKIEF